MRSYRIPFFDVLSKKHQLTLLLNKKPTFESYDYQVIGTKTMKSMWLDIKAMKTFISMLMFFDYDVFATSLPTASATIAGIVLARLRHKKIILWDEGWHSRSDRFKYRMRAKINKFIYRCAHSLFLTSSKTVNYAKNIAQIDDNKIFFACQCNLDMTKFEPKPFDLNIPKDHVVILYFSRIIDLKGLDFLIKAFHKCEPQNADKVSLLIVGDGDSLSDCKFLASSLDLKNCYFMMSLAESANSDKAHLYSTCDVFVLPSRIIGNQTEAWGLVVGEAMSMGKAVIVTDAVGCAGDMVRDGVNGYVVKHSSVKSLSKALNKIISDKNLRLEMGKNSRKIFEERISYEKMSQVFCNAVDFAFDPNKTE